MSVNLKSKPFIHNYPNVCFLFEKTDGFKTMPLVFPVSIKSHTFYKILLTNLNMNEISNNIISTKKATNLID